MLRTSAFISTLAIAAIFSTAPRARAADLFFSAMDLAVQNYNADGSKLIETWGPEHKQMLEALQAVATEYPDLKDVTKSSAQFGPKTYSQLSAEFNVADRPATEISSLMTHIGALGAGCGFERKTVIEEQDIGFSTASTNTSVTTKYRLGNLRAKKVCTAPIAKPIADLGLEILTIKEEERWGTKTVTISLGFDSNSWQDMRYLKSELLKVPGVNSSFVAALNPPTVGGLIGVSQDIELIGSTGQAALTDSFVLKYFQGSGDCPAGCISKTYTTIEVTPVTDAAGKTTFKLKAI